MVRRVQVENPLLPIAAVESKESTGELQAQFNQLPSSLGDRIIQRQQIGRQKREHPPATVGIFCFGRLDLLATMQT